MSTDNRPRTDLGHDDDFAPVIERAPRQSERKYWRPAQWLDLYLKEGLRIIPLYGAHDLDVYNPKKPGYPQWQKYVPRPDELFSAISQGKMWGCVCGSVSGNLQVVDYDLYKILDTKSKAVQWRRENIPLLRNLKTLVTFTPSGGFHIWLRTREAKPQPEVIMRFVKDIPFEMDLVRGEGQQVVIPPSKLKDVGNYWFMDDSEIRREGKLGIRVI